MSRGTGVALAGVVGAILLFAAPAGAASKNVTLQDNLPEAKYATAINFLQYKNGEDVMLVTGRFGLKTYSLRDPAHPTSGVNRRVQLVNVGKKFCFGRSGEQFVCP